MAHHVLVVPLLAAALSTPIGIGVSDAPPAAHALRSLRYDVSVQVSSVRETQAEAPEGARPIVVTRSGSLAASNRRRSAAAGSGTRTAKADVSSAGTIQVAVVEATTDAGLVLDVSENATQRVRPVARIAVASDGSMFFDPKVAENLTEEEVALVRWMARGFYGEHPTDPGTGWVVDTSTDGRTDIERYRVLSKEANRVTLDYELEEKAAGVTGYEASRAGSLVYDRTLLVPVNATFRSESRRDANGAYVHTSTSIVLTLIADSFAPKPER